MPDDPRLLPLLEAAYEVIGRGESLDLDAICRDAPDLVDAVRRLVAREQSAMSALGRERAMVDQELSAMPARIGDFALIEPLGTGGMSRVYRARQQSLDREVALKILRRDVVSTPTGRLRFQREATITASLDHRNIVPVYAAGEADGHVYLAMKLLRGCSLDRIEKPMPAAKVARIGVEIGGALQAAHEIGVLHRDVKPANIVLERDVAYVVDFGLSSFRHAVGTLTQVDTTPGTLLYMAPELITRRSPGVDPRIDVYGLGAVLYELLAARPPVESGMSLRVAHDIVNREPQRLSMRGRDRDLETIVFRALEKDPGRRFPSAADMAADLQRYLDGLPIRSRRVGVLERSIRHVRRRPWVSAAVVLFLLMSVVLGRQFLLVGEQAELRRAMVVAAVEQAIGGGDTTAAAEALAANRAQLAPSEVERLAANLAAERAMQGLLAILLATDEVDTLGARRVMVALTGSASTIARTPRAEALVALTSRVVSTDPVEHLPLSERARAQLPSTAARLSAWARGGKDEAVEPGSDPWDRVLAALACSLDRGSTASVEHRLRWASGTGYAEDVIRYFLAVVAERAGRTEESLDRHLRMQERPVFGVLASASSARLLAASGERERANRQIERARAGLVGAPQFAQVVTMADLYVRAEDPDPARYWELWQREQAVLGHLTHYWLLAGHQALAHAGDAETAALHYEEAARRAGDGPHRNVVDLARVELAWLVSPAAQDLEPLAAEADAATLESLRRLAARAEALAERAHREGSSAEVIASSLVVAAQARRSVGDRRRSWQLLEQASRSGSGDATVAHAFLTGYRCLQVLMGGDDADAAHGPPLGSAAGAVVARLHELTTGTEGARRLDDTRLAQAHQALLLCALATDDCDAALRAAIALQGMEGVHPSVRELAEATRSMGGVLLDRQLPVDGVTVEPRVTTVLAGACSAMASAHRAGTMTAAEVVAVLDRWQAHAPFARWMASAAPASLAVRDVVEELRRMVADARAVGR